MFNLYIRLLLGISVPRLFALLQSCPWYAEIFEQWSHNLNVQKNNTVIDVGCGPGLLTKSLAEKGCVATGLDQSKGMIDWAVKHNTNKPNTNAKIPSSFMLGDAFNLPYDDNYFDFSMAASLINIIPTPEKALQEMTRCIKPKGKVSFLVPSPEMTENNAIAYAKNNNINGLSLSLLLLWASKAASLSNKNAIALAEQAGLDNVVVDEYLGGMVISVTGEKSAD